MANAVRPVLRNRFLLGQFDPVNATIYTTLGVDDIASEEHAKINLDAALQSIVLLRNNGPVLPLKTGIKV